MTSESNRTSIPKLLTEGLPAARLNDLPDPKPLWGLLGPGVIMVATSIGSGEVYFWPGITMKHGFYLIWPALIAIYLQYVLNTEFARYTLATGETVVSGFARLWKPWAWIFLLCSTLPWLWPGWSMGGATAISWVTGGNPEIIAAISLFLMGFSLTGTKIAYKAVETLQLLMMAFILFVFVGIAFLVVRGPNIEAMARGLSTIPTSLPAGMEIATLLSALAFCGAGGSINLATCNWIRDKGFGMGAVVPKIVSPLSGEEVSVSSQSFFFEPTDENILKWNAWWRLVRSEQIITFLGCGLFGLVLLMLVSHSLLFNSDLEIGMGMLFEEGIQLGIVTWPWTTIVFYLMVSAVFLTSALGVLDHVARVSADIIKSNSNLVRKSKNVFLSESSIYFFVLWTLIGFAILVLFGTDIKDTPTLLRISGSLSGIVMFLYSMLIILLMCKLKIQTEKSDSRFAENNPFALPAWRLVTLIIAALFYGSFSVMLIIDLLKRYVLSVQ